MNETVRFLDQTGARPGTMDLWPAVVIPKETIDAEVERLASLPRPANGRRRSISASIASFGMTIAGQRSIVPGRAPD